MLKRKPAGGKALPAMLGGLRAWPAHARACLLALCLLPAAAGAAPFAYIPNADDDTVLIIDTATGLGTALVPVGDYPSAVAVAPATGRAYIANSSDPGSVSVIDSASDTVVATVPVAPYPYAIAAHPAGTRVYVTHFDATLSVIDARNHSVAQVVLDSETTMLTGVAVHPDGTRVYASDAYGDRVWVFDASTNAPITTIVGVGTGPDAIAVNNAGTRVYVANRESDTVTVIDATTNTVIDTVTVGSAPSAVAIHPNGTRVYVPDYNDDLVTVIDATTVPHTIATTVAVGHTPSAVDVTPDGTRVYVTNSDSNNVSVIDTTTNTVIPPALETGAFPLAFGRFIMDAAEVPPVIEVPDQTGTVGTAFSLDLSSYVIRTNGDTITGYAVASGTLPPGLTLNAASGLIAGTPSAAGTFNVTVTASDDDGPSNPDAIQFTIAAGAAVSIPTLSEWAMIVLAALMAATAATQARRLRG